MHLVCRFFFILIFFPINAAIAGNESNQDILAKEEAKLMELYREYAKFYDMPGGIELREITKEILNSPLVKDVQKQAISNFNRRIFVFTYPSDGLKIKGFISLVSDYQAHPLLVLLRGGTGIFAVLNPGSDLACPEQYSVLATMYRGGVSEGQDEYGGDDVNDVKNLIDYIPKLESKLGINIQNSEKFFIGASRGGMQMFLTLGRYPELQSHFSKVVSLSGLLDMRECIATRPDMEECFIKEMGLKKGINDDEWINRRDPILTVNNISSELPILIIQGTDDNRVTLQQGYNIISALQSASKNVTYWEFEAGKHCLNNVANRMNLILNWIEDTD